MYNEQVKKDFLISLRRRNIGYNAVVYRTIFDISEIFEESREKDLAYFTTEDYTELLKAFTLYDSLQVVAPIKAYVKWFKQYYDNELVISPMPKTMEIKKDSWRTQDFTLLHEDFIHKLVLSQLEENNPMFAFMIIGIYCGLRGKYYSELFHAKIEHINIFNKTLDVYSYNSETGTVEYNRTIPIDDFFIKIATIVDKTQSPENENKHSAYYYEKTDFIYKFGRETGNRTDPDILKYMTETVKRKIKLYKRKSGNDIVAEHIRISGIINNIIQAMNFYGVDFYNEKYIDIVNEIATRYNSSKNEIEKVRVFLEEK